MVGRVHTQIILASVVPPLSSFHRVGSPTHTHRRRPPESVKQKTACHERTNVRGTNNEGPHPSSIDRGASMNERENQSVTKARAVLYLPPRAADLARRPIATRQRPAGRPTLRQRRGSGIGGA